MRRIAFAWTTPAFLAGVKTCTRRDWKPSYARSLHPGDHLAAYDHLRGKSKPRLLGEIRVLEAPYRENIRDAPDSDFEREGIAYMQEHGFTMLGVSPAEFWLGWQESNPCLYVLRYEYVARQLRLLPEEPNHHALSGP